MEGRREARNENERRSWRRRRRRRREEGFPLDA